MGLVSACLTGAAAEEAGAPGAGRLTIGGAAFRHAGGGVFVPAEASEAPDGKTAHKPINLRKIGHVHDPARDPDVPVYTDVTLPGINPEFLDRDGRRYALITLYNIDPPLEDLPSKEAGVDRGMDYRDPSNLVKSAYSNYVSPVFTDDRERRPVPGHPIGHFYVKVQIPGYPTVLTGMTTIARADEELVEFTIDRGLGLGGALLTREPGRLNASAEVMEELGLRQRRLIVVDGVNYRREKGRNVGPVFAVEDGNVTFARFRLPVANALDALGVFLEFVDRGLHNHFGSLLSRPHRGTGAGCSAFAMLWLKGSGVIPIVDEAGIDAYLPQDSAHGATQGAAAPPFWARFYNRIHIPWDHIGCDDRVGLSAPPEPARYTIHDELFHGLSTEEIVAASEGLAAKVREDSGTVVGTLFAFGALTPLRDLVIWSKRNDAQDRGDYSWSTPADGLAVGFWDNGRFADWIKSLWRTGIAAGDPATAGLRLVAEGRFRGVEVDAMATPRSEAEFYRMADALAARRAALATAGLAARSCREVFLDHALE